MAAFFKQDKLFQIGAKVTPKFFKKDISLEKTINKDVDFKIKKSSLFSPDIVGANGSTFRSYREPMVGNSQLNTATDCACAILKYSKKDVSGFTLTIADGMGHQELVQTARAAQAAAYMASSALNAMDCGSLTSNGLKYGQSHLEFDKNLHSKLSEINQHTIGNIQGGESMLSCVTGWVLGKTIHVRGCAIGDASILAYSPSHQQWWTLGESFKNIASIDFAIRSPKQCEISYINATLPLDCVFVAMTDGITDALNPNLVNTVFKQALGNNQDIPDILTGRQDKEIAACFKRQDFHRCNNAEDVVSTILNIVINNSNIKRERILKVLSQAKKLGLLNNLNDFQPNDEQLKSTINNLKTNLNSEQSELLYFRFMSALGAYLARNQELLKVWGEPSQFIPTYFGDDATIITLQLAMKSWF